MADAAQWVAFLMQGADMPPPPLPGHQLPLWASPGSPSSDLLDFDDDISVYSEADTDDMSDCEISDNRQELLRRQQQLHEEARQAEANRRQSECIRFVGLETRNTRLSGEHH